jgi:hypothetical protein
MHSNEPSPRASRLDALLAKRALIERQLKAMAARQNAAQRKAEQRAKFILGGLALDRALKDPAFLESWCAELGPSEQQHVRAVVAALRSRHATG